MHRMDLIEEEVLKRDLTSEIVLTASGLILFLPLLLLLLAVLLQFAR